MDENNRKNIYPKYSYGRKGGESELEEDGREKYRKGVEKRN